MVPVHAARAGLRRRSDLFGLSRKYAGLEVKTMAQSGSLVTGLARVQKLWLADKQNYREENRGYAIARLKDAAAADPEAWALFNELTGSTVREFASMLIVRQTSLIDLTLAPWINEAYDVVLVFDAFNRLRWDVSRIRDHAFTGPQRAMLTGLGASFLLENARASLAKMGFDPSLAGW